LRGWYDEERRITKAGTAHPLDELGEINEKNLDPPESEEADKIRLSKSKFASSAMM
jgi:hypothetical protein